MRAKRGTASWAMGGNLITLVNQAFVPQLLQRPPTRFNIAIVQRDIGMLHVQPETDALGYSFPFLKIIKHTLSAMSIELSYAVVFNLEFVGKAQHLLYLQLHWQTMRIPPCLARCIITFHRSIPGDNILIHSR